MFKGRDAAEFYFIGDRLCLDFVNTQAIADGNAIDLLGGFDDLLVWCWRAQMINATQAEDLRKSGARDADQAFRQAIVLRTTLRGMFERVAAARRRMSNQSLQHINDILRTRAGELELVRKGEGYETRFRQRFRDATDLLVPVAESAADLLSTGNLALVRRCQNPRCILYFYDTTKNHARRWCSMTACGNRAKVAAHYRRTRG